MRKGTIASAAWLVLGLQAASGGDRAARWIEDKAALPAAEAPAPDAPVLALIRQDYERLERNRSVIDTPLAIGSRAFEQAGRTERVKGAALGARFRITLPEPRTSEVIVYRRR